jgi:hypothetical protein
MNVVDELVFINVKSFEQSSQETKTLFSEDFADVFQDYDTFKNFFIEIGNNHKNGVDIGYLGHKIAAYTTFMAMNNLMSLGIIKESYDENGNPIYGLGF